MCYWQKQDVSASFYDLLIFDWIFPSSITSTEEQPYLVNSYIKFARCRSQVVMSCNVHAWNWNCMELSHWQNVLKVLKKVEDVQNIKKIILACSHVWGEKKKHPKLHSFFFFFFFLICKKKRKESKGHPYFKTFWLDGLWAVLSSSTCTTNSTIQHKFILKLSSVPKYRYLCKHCTTFIHTKQV